MKKIYIILSYSGTFPSKIIKIFTRYKYSHVSLALNDNINKMYSFGRKKVNNPFNGGFIIETKKSSFYKKFNKTNCTIIEIEIENNKYKELNSILNKYKKDIEIYRYDILGLFLRIFKIKIQRKNYNICTEFVASLLREANIYNFNKKIIKPKDFLDIPNKKIIYQGKLLNY